MDHEILMYLLLGFMLDASDQTPCFISNITDDRPKRGMCRCKCQKAQRRKDSSTSVSGLKFENKCAFPILCPCLSPVLLIFVWHRLDLSVDHLHRMLEEKRIKTEKSWWCFNRLYHYYGIQSSLLKYANGCIC